MPLSRTLKIVVAVSASVALAATLLMVVTQGDSRTVADRQAGVLVPGSSSNAKQLKEITDLVLEVGVPAALKRVEYYRDSRTGSCHDLSHVTGRAAWAKYGNVAQAFNAGYDVCDFGYFHGIVEAAGAEMTPSEFKSRIPGMCAELLGDYLRYSQCAHGAGHGAFYLADGDMEKAMELCSGFPTNDPGVTLGCETGVSMEWFAVYDASSEKLTPKVADRREACVSVTEQFRSACFDYVFNGIAAMLVTDADIQRERDWCIENAGSSASRCVTSLSRITIAGMQRVPNNVVWICDGLDDRSGCVAHLMLAWVLHTGADVAAFERMCAQLPAIDRAPTGGCSSVRAQVERTVELGATNAPRSPAGS
jgi:hypothetical protein